VKDMAKQKFWEFKAKANSKDEADLYLYMQIQHIQLKVLNLSLMH